jgi:hypothetical protein
MQKCELCLCEHITQGAARPGSMHMCMYCYFAYVSYVTKHAYVGVLLGDLTEDARNEIATASLLKRSERDLEGIR